MVDLTAGDGQTAMNGSPAGQTICEHRYHVILIAGDSCKLTPGCPSIDEAGKKAAYLSKHGWTIILSARQLRALAGQAILYELSDQSMEGSTLESSRPARPQSLNNSFSYEDRPPCRDRLTSSQSRL